MKEMFTTHSPIETEQLGREIAEKLKKETKCAHIRLYGEMGVGKTAFVRGFCSAFGISRVKSPTYTIVNEYRGEYTVFHFDMVRIESDDDLYSVGFWEYLEREDAFVLIEWTENIDPYLTDGGIFISICRCDGDEDARTITIDRRSALTI